MFQICGSISNAPVFVERVESARADATLTLKRLAHTRCVFIACSVLLCAALICLVSLIGNWWGRDAASVAEGAAWVLITLQGLVTWGTNATLSLQMKRARTLLADSQPATGAQWQEMEDAASTDMTLQIFMARVTYQRNYLFMGEYRMMQAHLEQQAALDAMIEGITV